MYIIYYYMHADLKFLIEDKNCILRNNQVVYGAYYMMAIKL